MRRSRLVTVLILLIGYAALLYAVMHRHTPRSSGPGTALFSPVVSEMGEQRLGGLTARAGAQRTEDQSSEPARHWSFAAIDIWPSAAGWSASASEFTPVTEAQADNAASQKPRQSMLRMARWIRPQYPAALALAGQGGCVALELRIDPGGQPTEIRVQRVSGWPQIDASAASAARLWRFSPPLWNSRPIAVGARVEVRYNAQSQTAPAGGTECAP